MLSIVELLRIEVRYLSRSINEGWHPGKSIKFHGAKVRARQARDEATQAAAVQAMHDIAAEDWSEVPLPEETHYPIFDN